MRISYYLFLTFCFMLTCCSNKTSDMTHKSTSDARLKGTFTLYQLDGDRYPGDPVPEGAVLLHEWPILQSCSITSLATREQLFKALDDGIDQWSGTPIDCFNPRHGIRVESDGVNVDYLICFQCQNYQIWEGDKHVSGGMTTASPKSTFDSVLDACRKRR